ncbi:Predicted oxidoreductase [Gemmobacter megaterium]|uniref:Predicted oxidoreductase n=1 Tax=Gemmobacter megaterium TaxID=1086013 RepID=A0A1N7MLB4_9RHOB|nr:aldo/keto reductase [Gemmobacter megaterium]GGE06202.1 NADP-dependent oxidoreductase [Gemmobacter megaterium]SIS86820.1 Predicted oxidoreductase [Gemmobacter megaterium]
MQKLPLGRSGLQVSELCLGTMTWGSQNTESEGHAQMDMALDHGVNFLDAAEMYPTNPVRAETVGRTEEIIGSWMASHKRRGDWVIATKITGAGHDQVRGGAPITGAALRSCVEQALRRLKTDVIDLYQLHWPNRGSYHFRRNWGFDPTGQDRAAVIAHMQDVLAEAGKLVSEGKIRAFGLSNESAWGTAQWLRLAEVNGWPRVASIQNEYSLLCRHFDSDLAELCHNEAVTPLAFSPLAAGLLSGKYAGDVTPDKTRRVATPDLGGRITPQVFPAVAAYLGVAADHGLDPCQMALAFVRSRPVPTIPIIGATTLEQLRTNLGAAGLTLSDEVLADIAATRRQHPMPY